MAQSNALKVLIATPTSYERKDALKRCSRFYGTLEDLNTTGAQVSGARIREEIEDLFRLKV